jgi:hypothetical protein
MTVAALKQDYPVRELHFMKRRIEKANVILEQVRDSGPILKYVSLLISDLTFIWFFVKVVFYSVNFERNKQIESI